MKCNKTFAIFFNDYSRAKDSRVSGTQGTGLGMSVVKGFRDLMHGKLTIDSEPGVGSTFTVEIPFGQADERQQQAVLEAKAEGELPDPRYVGQRILLAEDNMLNAEIASELLKTIGFEVDWVENGQQAVERVTGAKQVGMNGFVTKPISVKNILAALKACGK